MQSLKKIHAWAQMKVKLLGDGLGGCLQKEIFLEIQSSQQGSIRNGQWTTDEDRSQKLTLSLRLW